MTAPVAHAVEGASDALADGLADLGGVRAGEIADQLGPHQRLHEDQRYRKRVWAAGVRRAVPGQHGLPCTMQRCGVAPVEGERHAVGLAQVVVAPGLPHGPFGRPGQSPPHRPLSHPSVAGNRPDVRGRQHAVGAQLLRLPHRHRLRRNLGHRPKRQWDIDAPGSPAALPPLEQVNPSRTGCTGARITASPGASGTPSQKQHSGPPPRRRVCRRPLLVRPRWPGEPDGPCSVLLLEPDLVTPDHLPIGGRG